MGTKIDEAIRRLQEQLPLQARQEQLDESLASIHRAILQALAETGRPLTNDEISELSDDGDPSSAIKRLGEEDLVVLDTKGEHAVGAYPMTTEETPHHLSVNGHLVNAMCALDAVAVAPMFNREVVTRSRCHVTGEPIHVRQKGDELLDVSPSKDVQVGIRWQSPKGCAAHSMCLEMVFLKDLETAKQWQGSDVDSITLFDLDEAIAFGARFFKPLLRKQTAAAS